MQQYFRISFFSIFSLRGFLSIDIDVSGLYINQCDRNNQFYSDSYSVNFHNPKVLHLQPTNSQFQIAVPLQPLAPLHIDNEIDAFHDSHKCHRDSMDVCT